MREPEDLPLFEPEQMDGIELKELGMSRVESASDPRERDRIDEALLRLARSGKIFTAQDVRLLSGAPIRPNLMGSRFHHARKMGLIETCGTELSQRRSRRGGAVWRWRGTVELREGLNKKEAELARQREKELDAMQKILHALEGFERPQLLRIIGYVVERVEIGPVSAALAAEKAKLETKEPEVPEAT